MKRRTAWLWFAVLVAFIILHLYMFRGVISHVPEILGGREVVTVDELIPLFDFRTQFLNQIVTPYSDLTRADEVRVGYSFLTSWVRHPVVLPFALVLMNALSAWILCVAIYLTVEGLLKPCSKGAIVAVSAFVGFAVHSLVLYAKLTHFYTLCFGFSMFCMHLAMLMRGLFEQSLNRRKWVLSAGFMALANPGIHYQALSVVAWMILVVCYVVLKPRGVGLGHAVKRAGLTLFVLCTIVTLPYLGYTQFLLSRLSQPVSMMIPVGYHTVAGGSLTVWQAMTLVSGSPVSMFREGRYVPAGAWPEMMVYPIIAVMTGLAIRLLLRGDAMPLRDGGGAPLSSLYVLFGISIWMSLGYRVSVSFHSAAAHVARLLYGSDLFAARVVMGGLNTLIQFLRFPHRFQFITFFALSCMVAVGPVCCFHARGSRRGTRRARLVLGVSLLVLLLAPLLANSDLRAVLWSGDFGGMLVPFAVGDELKNVKALVSDATQNSRLIVLPSVNGGLYVRDAEGRAHWLHDKFFLYFFNVPSILYSIGSPDNVSQGFLLYNAFQSEEGSWISVLRNNNIRYVVFIDDTVPRPRGPVYLAGIEDRMRVALLHSDELVLLHDGPQYKLFEVQPCAVVPEASALVSTSWRNYLASILPDERLYCRYRLYHGFELAYRRPVAEIRGGRVLLVPSESTKALIDVAVLTEDQADLWLPQLEIVPFSRDVVHLSRYWTPMFSLFTLLNPRSPYNSFGTLVPGPFDTLSGTVTGVNPGARVIVRFEIAGSGKHTLYLRGLFPDGLHFDVERTDGRFSVRVKTAGSYGRDVEYGYALLGSYHLNQGRYVLSIANEGPLPLVLEGVVTLVESGEVSPVP